MAFGTIQMAMTAVHLGDTDTAWRLLCSIAENNYYNTFSPFLTTPDRLSSTAISAAACRGRDICK